MIRPGMRINVWKKITSLTITEILFKKIPVPSHFPIQFNYLRICNPSRRNLLLSRLIRKLEISNYDYQCDFAHWKDGRKNATRQKIWFRRPLWRLRRFADVKKSTLHAPCSPRTLHALPLRTPITRITMTIHFIIFLYNSFVRKELKK